MMQEILITSSALILALLVIRRVFKGVLSRRFQYALWALVLARLLIPNSLSTPAADFSVLNATAPVQNAVVRRLDSQIHYSRPQGQVSQAELTQRDISVEYIPTAQDGFVLGESEGSGQPTTWLVRDPETNTVTRYADMTVGPWEILNAVWKAGMVLMGAFFFLSNVLFYRRLRTVRRPFVGADVPIGPTVTRPVYLIPNGVIPSPCLFGRSIYITPAVAGDENKLRHVLAHEETHARHLDPLWSLLRCACLTVYWFDPLVWVAAACSKADCELACDESVLNTLGETERIPYGQTLVSLIPVKRVGNPMLAATTMTAGKKQLTDRVRRIAKRPRQFAAAALAVAALAGVVSACTFTGAKPEATPGPVESQEPQGPRALTGEELRWFNEEFFNHNPNPVISYTYSIRNQFISSVNLYDKPEDIDLYELFYCDGDVYDNPENDICPSYKITEAQINAILTQYTGLTLEQTNKVGLENFTHRDDAYYWSHGDTNYPGDIEIICGTREGSTVKLYHHGWNSGSQWYCTTLKDRAGEDTGPYGEQGESRYWFVSNRESEQPSIPTPLPAWEPEAVISLKVIEPYAAPAVTVEAHPNHYSYSYETCYANWNIDDHHIMVYRASDDVVYAAYVEDDIYYVFQSGLEGKSDCVFFFHDLLGHNGFWLDYYGSYEGSNNFWPIRDYYYFDGSGVLTLLARCRTGYEGAEPSILDLNGDWQNELVSSRQLFFLQDGVVYEAQLEELVKEACPELENWDYSAWDKYGKCLYVRGYTGEKEWSRYLYFDGEHILVYKNEKPTTDHMVDGIADGVPSPVVSAARDYVENAYIEAELALKEAELQNLIQQQAGALPPTYDDWRVEAFYGPYTYSHGGRVVEAWQFNYEMHTVTPEQIVLAGGKYITEDDWVSPGYPGCDTLFFLVDGEKRSYLNYRMVQESMNSSYVNELVLQLMEEKGVELSDGATYAAQEIELHLAQALDHGDGQVYLQYADAESHGAGYSTDSDSGNADYFRRYLTDPENYRWTKVGYLGEMMGHASLIVAHSNWDCFLQFWEGSDLVSVKYMNQEPQWYRAEQVTADDVFGMDVFHLMRHWFDEVEIEALEQNVVIPDRGQSQEKIAQELIEAYEGAHLKVLPGSLMSWSYMEVRDLRIDQNIARKDYPDWLDGEEAFLVWYSTVFVPEGDPGWFMAGNTVGYEGNDVPDGALQWWHCAYLYLAEDGWRVDSVGTGP